MLSQGLIGLLIALALESGDLRLPEAAMKGDRAAVQALLKEKVEVNSSQGDGNTALHWAAYREDVETARVLIQAGADVRVKTRIGSMTPLFMAAKNGNAAIVDLLLMAGADVNVVNDAGTTPLMLAAASGDAASVRRLLDAGADINAKDATNGQTALMFAAALDRGSVIRTLVERGAELNILSKVSQIRQYVDDAPDEDRQKVPTMGGNSALHFATREGQMEAVRALVEAGADVNIQNLSEKTPPLVQAILIGHFDIAKYLVEHGADPNIDGGIPALFETLDMRWASRDTYPAPIPVMEQQQTDHLELVNALLDHGANPNARTQKEMWFRRGNRVGATAFYRAAEANDLPAMRLLLAAGADPNIGTDGGISPLMAAAGMNHDHLRSTVLPASRFEAVKFLVDQVGAQVNWKDSRDYTPLHAAAKIGRNDIVLYLFEHGADVTARANQVGALNSSSIGFVGKGNGDTVADMANGFSMNDSVYPETVALLMSLGSVNSNYCRSSTCVNPTRPDRGSRTK